MLVSSLLTALVTSVPATSTSPTPTPSPTAPECVQQAAGFCRFVFDVTGNSRLARAADWLVAKPVAIVIIIAVALVARLVVRKFIDRVVERIAAGRTPRGHLRPRRTRSFNVASPIVAARRRQRIEAMGSVLRSIASFVILVIAILMILSALGLDVRPALASAGIAGIALGFGAQNLIRDFLAGIFMIFEDQYGVGDVITALEITGTVEEVGLRITHMRDDDGVIWYVRNGEMTKVGNRSQGHPDGSGRPPDPSAPAEPATGDASATATPAGGVEPPAPPI